MSIEVRLSGKRFVTAEAGRTTRHSFSFGAHYDPSNLGFASMVALNDEELPPGTGYPDHGHSDLEIVTWVLTGALRHTDGNGNTEVLLPGDIQRISAGSGIVHSEVTEPGAHTRFLQTWLRPDEPGRPPSYARTPVGDSVGDSRAGSGAGQFTEVTAPGSPLSVNSRGASLHLADLTRGTIELPDAPSLHLFVAAGTVELGDRVLEAGDAARLVDEGGRGLTVPASATLSLWAFKS